MTRPRIGITVDHITGKPQYALPFTYAEAIELAGGLPVMIPYRVDVSLIPHYLDQLDGTLLSGGDDLDPTAWGETWHPNAKHIDPCRQRWEMMLLEQVEGRRMPVLGICLGVQLMNVYRGGSLNQFLPDRQDPDALEHRLCDDWSRRHGVELTPETHVARITGKSQLSVNTSHKQAIARLGRDLIVTAIAPDGVIEGIEDASLPCFFGVQWHAERQCDEADQLKLFEHLIDHAGRYALTRSGPESA
jgi:putative glutamine amidotransferase